MKKRNWLINSIYLLGLVLIVSFGSLAAFSEEQTQQYYILDGFGGVHSLGGAPVYPGPYFGWDIAKQLIPYDGGKGYYVLDGYGAIHAYGEAPPINGVYFGWDIARDIVSVLSSTEPIDTATPIPNTSTPTATPTSTPENYWPELTLKVEGMSPQDLTDAGLSGTATTGLKNVGVGSVVYLRCEATDKDGDDITNFTWEIKSAPSSSVATINPITATVTIASASFVPDLEGAYTIGITATDARDAVSDQATIILSAGKYVGYENCATCHSGTFLPDMVTPWSKTGHATMFSRGIDGEVSSHYSSNCISCHTVGYDTTASAVNGGFDDVALASGWVFPASLEAGNWDNVKLNHPELAKVANIQCESCHGPGSRHNGNTAGIDSSLDAGVCGSCHDALSHHTKNYEWENSAHYQMTTYPTGSSHTSCVKCHSGKGFIDFLAGKEELRTDPQDLTCAVCHDPHGSAGNEHQLRTMADVKLPDGTIMKNPGNSAACMNCHNGRSTPEDALEGHYPHYANGTAMLAGSGAYEYDETFSDSYHSSIENPCVVCHMAEGPGEGEPGHLLVGEHTFRVKTDNGTPDDPSDDIENIKACTTCHPGLESFNRQARGDYDGDGTIEGIQDEVQGLLDILLAEIQKSGVTTLEHYPYWQNVTTDDQKKAIFNYSFVYNDYSLGVHNTAYAVQLLQKTYTKFTGTAFSEAYPKASIR